MAGFLLEKYRATEYLPLRLRAIASRKITKLHAFTTNFAAYLRWRINDIYVLRFFDPRCLRSETNELPNTKDRRISRLSLTVVRILT